MDTGQPTNNGGISMSLENLRQERPDVWIVEVMKRKEGARYQANKDIVRELLIKHDAQDLIPMILGSTE
jgi:hypothetical protein